MDDTTRKSPPAEVSKGLTAFLARHRVSLVCSSYQTGRLFFVGSRANGAPVFSAAQFPGAMGLAAFSQRIYLAGSRAIWRLENVLGPDEVANEHCDRLYVPRNAQIIGDLDAHELCVEPSGRIVFVNTKYSCIATVSMTQAFTPLWTPPFISRLAPEDRCHLNGLGMDGDKVRFVTACNTTDIVDGWREHRADGGVLIDMADNRVLAEGLSMPHSPRLHGGFVWFLNSGSGHLCRLDLESGKHEEVAFCPGFLRGLAFVDDYAVVTLSLPRNGRFQGLALGEELERRKAAAWCGVMVIDTRNGDVVEWMRLDREFAELFDVALIQGVRCPTAQDGRQATIERAITN